jgi:cytochrome b561
MPLTPNNPGQQPKRSGGWGWLVPLLIAAPTIINLVRSRTTGILTDEQLLMIAAGVGTLIVLVVVGRRAWQSNVAVPPSPTYNPQQSSALPQAPRYEPILTGKVLLAGLVLGVLFAGGVVALLTLW